MKLTDSTMTAKHYYSLPQSTVNIDASASGKAYEWWRHTIGHGGINSLPLPKRVIEGSAKLKPRLVRTFIQQYFEIYPDHDQFDWTLLLIRIWIHSRQPVVKL